MYTDKDFEELDQAEQEQTDELIAALILLLRDTQAEISDETLKFYTKYGHNGVVTYKDSRKRVSLKDKRMRITILMLAITNILMHGFNLTKFQIRSHLKDIIENELNFFNVKLNVSDLLSMTWGADELNWADRLFNMYDKWSTVISDDLLLAFVKGDSISDVTKTLNKRFKSMDNATRRLVEAEESAIRSMTRQKIFKELGAKRYQYFTQADERTCETCGALHGLIFPMTAFQIGVTAPPIHPHCRDWIVPII